MKILITGEAPVWFLKDLSDLGHDVSVEPSDTFIDEACFCDAIGSYHVLVSGGHERITSTVLQAAARLRAIILLGAFDPHTIDSESAAKRGITIYGTPGANARAVAEFSLFLMLCALRRGARCFADLGIGVWHGQSGHELQGRTIGLVGSGNIARQLSRALSSMDTKVLYWGPSGRKAHMHGSFTPLSTLLERADIISLHVPYAGETLLGAAQLSQMKHGAVLINTSPAPLVNADALFEALRSERLSCAAFDGFYANGAEAWRCPQTKLLSLGPDKFFVTPQMGWQTREAEKRIFAHASRIIERLEPLEVAQST